MRSVGIFRSNTPRAHCKFSPTSDNETPKRFTPIKIVGPILSQVVKRREGVLVVYTLISISVNSTIKTRLYRTKKMVSPTISIIQFGWCFLKINLPNCLQM